MNTRTCLLDRKPPLKIRGGWGALCVLSFLCFIVSVWSVSPVHARGEECSRCEQDCRLKLVNPGPKETRECMLKSCSNCVTPAPGSVLYCWCKAASNAASGLCENHTRKDGAGDGPFQNCYDCQDYCDGLGAGRSALHCDLTWIDWNKKTESEGGCRKEAPKAVTPATPLAPGTAGSPAELYNPLGQDVTLFTLIGRLIRAVIGIVGALALLMFVYGGILWITSSGSETRVKQAKGILINSTIGLLIIFFSYTIISLFFGLFTP